MAKTVISVEHLTKQYDLGVIGSGTLTRDINRWWARVRGKPDPYTTIGHENRYINQGETILALDDLSFSVTRGEALGIIGPNGAGKSTLLKILSRVTSPTDGIVKMKGRIGSLLEVGTGFHGELTGRENAYLNGAILGMRKEEVDKKFDEIVAFSGVEKFIDTPVKRYSSGMYVRLAFSVAAHLDPEILIVDEVLAVGDAEFQKKCLGKMSDFGGEGRTVLFVSHNMKAIQNLCDRTIVLTNGNKIFDGDPVDAMFHYLRTTTKTRTEIDWPSDKAPGNQQVRLLGIKIRKEKHGKPNQIFTVNDELEVMIEFENLMEGNNDLHVNFHLRDETTVIVFAAGSGLNNYEKITPGRYKATCRIPANFLNQGTYSISKVTFVKDHERSIFDYMDGLSFDIIKPATGKFGWMGKRPGLVAPDLDWELTKIQEN